MRDETHDKIQEAYEKNILTEASNMKLTDKWRDATGSTHMTFKTKGYKDLVLVCEYPSMAKQVIDILKYCSRIG